MKIYSYTTIKIAAFAMGAALLSSCASLYIKSGREAFNDMKYQDAIWYLERGLSKKDDASARKMLAESYLRTNDFAKANEQFTQTALYTDNTDTERVMEGQAKMATGEYVQAQSIFEGIVSRDPANKLAQSLLSSCKKLNEMKADSFMYVVSPVSIPTSAPVFSPSKYKDGFVVTSPGEIKLEKDPYTNNAFTDLYFTKPEGSGWSALTLLEGVNSPYHDAAAVFSANGQTMVFTRSLQLFGGALAGNEQNISPNQIYISRQTAEGTWDKPSLIPFCDVKYQFAHPALSPDGKTLYFVSDMPGGFGGLDIYASKLQDDGTWGTPANLGGDVNSSGNETFPTLKDENTLFFSSNGLKTLGGSDINYSERVNGVWGIPKHFSYPVNSERDDFGLIWNADGKTGYFTSDRTGTDKIYNFEEFRSVIALEGKITGKDSMLPLGGTRITIMNLTDGTEQTIFSDGDGNFKIDLPGGKDYKIKSELEGYFTTSEDLSTKGINSNKKLTRVFELQEAYVDNTPKDNNKGTTPPKGSKTGKYPVPNIYWDYNKWDIRSDAFPYLDEVVKLFRNNQNLKFEIRSHTDCRGSNEYNNDLSSKRAKAVLEYLVQKGVPRSIITSKGYGESELLNDCTDGVQCPEDQHQENRRTEFIVTDKK
jgi:outer membrane protein OmpA-like peptidoglycan-associated protein/tetratricopeptide (TPR) repeat protein